MSRQYDMEGGGAARDARKPGAREPEVERGWRDFARRFVKNRRAMAGGIVILGLICVAIFAPHIAPRCPYRQNVPRRLEGPSSDYWLGTDELGRDVLSRIIYGSRVSLLVSLGAMTFSMALGITLGTLAGYYRGALDNIIMRLVDVFLALPVIVLAIALVAVLGGASLFNVIVALGITGWRNFARVMRGQILAIREREYVMAAEASGASPARVMIRHLLPNAIAPMIVMGTLQMAYMIITEASLSFLGLGVPPPTASWGGMLSTGRRFLQVAMHTATFPGLAIMITVLGFNLLGDALRDLLDPSLR